MSGHSTADIGPSTVLQPETTLAIVLGASEWPFCSELESLPSCRRSAQAVADYFRFDGGLNISPHNLLALIDPSELAPAILKEMRVFVQKRCKDLTALGKPPTDLLFYYVGHAGFSTNDALFLSVGSTDEDDPIATGITPASLAKLVRDTAGGLRTYLVLDCCYAASVLGGFLGGGPVEATVAQFRGALPSQGDSLALQNQRLPAYGIAMLCASGASKRAKAPDDLAYTMFTSSMLEVLKQGEPTAPAWLSLNDVHLLIQKHLEAKFADHAIWPEVYPVRQDQGRIDAVPLFRNVARPIPPVLPLTTQVTEIPEITNQSPETTPDDRSTRTNEIVKLKVPPGFISDMGKVFKILGQTAKELWDGTGLVQRHQIAAENGDAVSQVYLGLRHERGDFFTPKSEIEAARFYKLAADQGDAYGQNNLGTLYERGFGVPKSAVEAARLYKLAADQGNAYGQTNLGSLYERGIGVPKSFAKAARLFKLAADQGNALAQVSLGSLHENGRGVSKSFAKAARLFKLAAEQGNARGQSRLGALYMHGRGVVQSYDEAVRLLKLAADQGDALGQTSLGHLYENGLGVPKSDDEAARLFKLAADQGDVVSQYRLSLS